ncbi:MAG: hypothetical protein DMG70_04555 [Acidobacteria bacterium]|nr:MAG: hypothetical protein DMG70_04555 [Acidobacteriota bacterium]
MNMVIAPPGSQIPKRFTSDMRLLLAREPSALLQCPRVVEKPFPPRTPPLAENSAPHLPQEIAGPSQKLVRGMGLVQSTAVRVGSLEAKSPGEVIRTIAQRLDCFITGFAF